MPTRNVVLTEFQAELVERLVASGRYQNASEVLRAGLRLVESQEADDAAKLAALRAAVQVGIDDLEAGRYQSFASAAEVERYVMSIARETPGSRKRGPSRG
jgi:antitoxin ParD1/3/4